MEVERDRGDPTPRTALLARQHRDILCQYRSRKVSCSVHHVLLSSKQAILILLWTITVGSVYTSAMFAIPLAVPRLSKAIHISGRVLFTVLVVNMFLAVTMMLYPLGGLLGDVRLGRYRTVVIGLSLLLAFLTIASIGSILSVVFNVKETLGTVIQASFILLALLSFILLVSGFSAFESNVIQLELDQLMEAPSESLGVFVHWFVWANRFGQVIIQVLYATRQCSVASPATRGISYIAIPATLFLMLVVFLFVNCCTHHRFNTERVKYNPYKMIIKILNFARKNRYPVGQTSAFAYCDDTIPSRIDYAKERYGGPFTTSDVEDVKTFIRVLLVLLAIAPVFILDVPASYILFSMFALHTGQEMSVYNGTCNVKWMLLESGTLSDLTSVVILPIYMWTIYSVFRNKVPKMLVRIGFAICLYIIAIISMFVVDLAGHIALQIEQQPNAMCMFVVPYLDTSKFDTLNLHWSVLILPNLLKDLAPDLIMATAFEFISAQSPHTMKGVLVGTLFALRGFFLFVGMISLFPFALDEVWKHGRLGDDPPVTSCGFGYYLVTTVVALLGLCLFIIAVKKYKYRKREEEPFSQARVEEIFSRRIQQRQLISNNDRFNRLHTGELTLPGHACDDATDEEY